MHTLELYTRCDGDIPMALITVPNKNEVDAQVGYGYVKVTADSDIFGVPNGTNPRALNPNSPKVKAIRETLETQPGFAVYNGGLCLVVDDGSLQYDDVAKTVSFTCEQDGSGHYDGQHTRDAIRQSATHAEGQQFAVMLVENKFFPDTISIRRAAETWNSRQTQKPHSEQNQRGVFDTLKSSLSAVHRKNVGWRENDTNQKGYIIEKECRIDRLVALLYTAVPILRSDYLDGADTMHSILRTGYGATKVLEDGNKSNDFARLFGHADLVMDLNDFIQENLREAYGLNASDPTGFDNLQIVRKSKKPDMKKRVTDRKFLAQMLFNGERATAGLQPEYIQPIMYGLLNNVLTVDPSGNVILGYGFTQADVEQIWMHSARSVLDMLDNKFDKFFNSRFNSRHAEFGCWSTLWTECEILIRNTIHAGTWKTPAVAK